MKKAIVILLLILMLAIAIPAAAKAKETVGEKINVLTGAPEAFTAGEPFHIAHGWGFSPPEDKPHGKYEFWLDVDGVMVEPDFISRSGGGSPLIIWLWVHNFPDGMTGTHTFTGHWLAPCKYADLEGAPPGACPTSKGQFEALTQSLTVTFTP